MELSSAIKIFIMFLKMTPLDGFAAKLESDLADGKISLREGVGLSVIATEEAQKFLPGQKDEIELANDIAEAVQKYLDAKAAAGQPVA